MPSQGRKPTSKKKSPSKPRGRYSNIRSSGYGSKQAGKKAAWSPADVGKQKVKGELDAACIGLHGDVDIQ